MMNNSIPVLVPFVVWTSVENQLQQISANLVLIAIWRKGAKLSSNEQFDVNYTNYDKKHTNLVSITLIKQENAQFCHNCAVWC